MKKILIIVIILLNVQKNYSMSCGQAGKCSQNTVFKLKQINSFLDNCNKDCDQFKIDDCKKKCSKDFEQNQFMYKQIEDAKNKLEQCQKNCDNKLDECKNGICKKQSESSIKDICNDSFMLQCLSSEEAGKGMCRSNIEDIKFVKNQCGVKK